MTLTDFPEVFVLTYLSGLGHTTCVIVGSSISSVQKPPPCQIMLRSFHTHAMASFFAFSSLYT